MAFASQRAAPGCHQLPASLAHRVRQRRAWAAWSQAFTFRRATLAHMPRRGVGEKPAAPRRGDKAGRPTCSHRSRFNSSMSTPPPASSPPPSTRPASATLSCTPRLRRSVDVRGLRPLPYAIRQHGLPRAPSSTWPRACPTPTSGCGGGTSRSRATRCARWPPRLISRSPLCAVPCATSSRQSSSSCPSPRAHRALRRPSPFFKNSTSAFSLGARLSRLG